MKKTISLLALWIVFLGNSYSVFATQGACSSHGGVNCSAGADIDGSVICNDGWDDSSVQYEDMEMCKEEVLSCIDRAIDTVILATEDMMEAYASPGPASCMIMEVWLERIQDSKSVEEWFLEYLLEEKDAFKDDSLDLYIEESELCIEYHESSYEILYNGYYYPLCVEELKLQSSENNFTDLPSNHANINAILYLNQEGIVSGYEDGTFRPNNEINRAELIKILVESLDIQPAVSDYNNCFEDVAEDWYAPYVCYAKDQGWVNGYSDGTFKPGQNVNKVESIKILLNSQNIEVPDSVDEAPFLDMNTEEWFVPYITQAKELNLLEEEGPYFFGAQNMKRAGVCENIYRLLTLE